MTDEVLVPALPASRAPVAGRLVLRVGIIMTMALLLCGFVSLIWTPGSVVPGGATAQLQPPSSDHFLGTDAVGRDVLSLIMKGILTSYVVAAVGTAIALFVGTAVGIVTGVTGGAAAVAARRLADATGILPALGIASILVVHIGPGPVATMIAIGLGAAPLFLHAAEKAVSQLKSLPFVTAARLAGQSLWEALRQHSPHRLSVALTFVAARVFAVATVAEGAFAYVGLGVQPGGTSLGQLLREGQSTLGFTPLPALAPGVAIMLISAAMLCISEGLRHRIEARLVLAEDGDAIA